MIIEVPVCQLRKMKKAEGTVSVNRETQHFCGLWNWKMMKIHYESFQKRQQCTDRKEYSKENGN